MTGASLVCTTRIKAVELWEPAGHDAVQSTQVRK